MDGALQSDAVAVTLHILRGRASQAARRMEGATLLLGSDFACDIQLRSPRIAGRHLLLTRRADVVLARALCQPVLRNGSPFAETSLCDGDILTLGPFELRIQIESTQNAADIAPTAHTDLPHDPAASARHEGEPGEDNAPQLLGTGKASGTQTSTGEVGATATPTGRASGTPNAVRTADPTGNGTQKPDRAAEPTESGDPRPDRAAEPTESGDPRPDRAADPTGDSGTQAGEEGEGRGDPERSDRGTHPTQRKRNRKQKLQRCRRAIRRELANARQRAIDAQARSIELLGQSAALRRRQTEVYALAEAVTREAKSHSEQQQLLRDALSRALEILGVPVAGLLVETSAIAPLCDRLEEGARKLRRRLRERETTCARLTAALAQQQQRQAEWESQRESALASARQLESKERELEQQRNAIEELAAQVNQKAFELARRLERSPSSPPPSTSPRLPTATGVPRGPMLDQRLVDQLRQAEILSPKQCHAAMELVAWNQPRPAEVLVEAGMLSGYQWSMIRAGRMDALRLGPAVVIDRIHQGTLATTYAVKLPGQTALGQRNWQALRVFETSPNWSADSRRSLEVSIGQWREFVHPRVAPPTGLVAISSDSVHPIHEGLLAANECSRPAPKLGIVSAGIDGIALSAIDREQVPPPILQGLLAQAIEGLAAIYTSGFRHGGLRPSRMLIDRRGGLTLIGPGLPHWLLKFEACQQIPVAEGSLPYSVSASGEPAADLRDLARAFLVGNPRAAEQFSAAVFDTLRRWEQGPQSPHVEVEDAEFPATASLTELARLRQRLGQADTARIADWLDTLRAPPRGRQSRAA